MKAEAEKYLEYKTSPLAFIEDMWNLIPQPFASNEKKILALNTPFETWKPEWFGKFVKGIHITWQQYAILLAVERSINWIASKRISIRSWHGVGKSCTLSWILLWFLFVFKESQISCTAPSSEQMHDVLWKEVQKWKERLPDEIWNLYDVTTWYVRMKELPWVWFARAKTARKENPEALAWIHWDNVMLLVDEASWVPEEIFNTAEWALTEQDILYLMISNPTRLVWFFYDSHHGDKEYWQTLHFNCLDSPIVDHAYVTRKEQKHWKDSDEYRVRVEWKFPDADALDESWFVALLHDKDLRLARDMPFTNKKKMWIDPSWEWSNATEWVIRDKFKAKIVATEKMSTWKSIAIKTLTLMEEYKIKGDDITMDSFWEWIDAVQELAISGVRVNAVNVWKPPEDKDIFVNSRAEAYWRLKQWIKKWWELIWTKNKKEWDELRTIRYRAELSWKLVIMSKRDMKKNGYKSPDKADALMLTFTEDDDFVGTTPEELTEQHEMYADAYDDLCW